jgi:hypothetical protein
MKVVITFDMETDEIIGIHGPFATEVKAEQWAVNQGGPDCEFDTFEVHDLQLQGPMLVPSANIVSESTH